MQTGINKSVAVLAWFLIKKKKKAERNMFQKISCKSIYEIYINSKGLIYIEKDKFAHLQVIRFQVSQCISWDFGRMMAIHSYSNTPGS